MNIWRNVLLLVTLIATTAAYVAMVWLGEPAVRITLGLLTLTFVVAGVGVLWVKRAEVDRRVFTANLTLGAIVHVTLAGVFVAGDRLAALGVVPTLSLHWHYFVAGTVGVVAALYTWSKAKGEPPAPKRFGAGVVDKREAPPPPVPELAAEPSWLDLEEEMHARGDSLRLRHLNALERLSRVLNDDHDTDEKTAEARIEQATRVLRQEVLRLTAESRAATNTVDDNDVLSQAAAFFEWGAQKLPELAHMDVPDLLLAQAVAEIRASKSSVEHVFIDHRALRPIHPINRPTAEAKADERAAALRSAEGLIRANGMKLSEELIAAHDELLPLKSVTGFQVVEMGPGEGYVTFEGNGRRAAIERAFHDEPVEVEVRLFRFPDEQSAKRIRDRIRNVQRSNGTV